MKKSIPNRDSNKKDRLRIASHAQRQTGKSPHLLSQSSKPPNTQNHKATFGPKFRGKYSGRRARLSKTHRSVVGGGSDGVFKSRSDMRSSATIDLGFITLGERPWEAANRKGTIELRAARTDIGHVNISISYFGYTSRTKPGRSVSFRVESFR